MDTQLAYLPESRNGQDSPQITEVSVETSSVGVTEAGAASGARAHQQLHQPAISPIPLRPSAPVAPQAAAHASPSALPPTATHVRLSTPQHRAWKIESGRLVIDHAAENIRHVLQDGMEMSGDMTFSSGGLAMGGRHRNGTLRVSEGTLIVLDGAVVEGEIDAVNIYNLGTISSPNVRASGLLVNWGTLKGGVVSYGALENYGELEGTLTKIKA